MYLLPRSLLLLSGGRSQRQLHLLLLSCKMPYEFFKPSAGTLSGIPNPYVLIEQWEELQRLRLERDARRMLWQSDQADAMSTLQVMDYLIKKGYTKTEAMLRAESSNQETSETLRIGSRGAPKYFDAYRNLNTWINESLDIYKPELQRVLWPMFVNCYIRLILKNHYQPDGAKLMRDFKESFVEEHADDLRVLERIVLPEHFEQDNIGKLYKDNKYRLVMSSPAFSQLMQFLESLPSGGDKLLIPIIQENFDLREVDRALDDRLSFASIILRSKQDPQDYPAEDEGIPGHRPGNAISSTDPNVGNTLATLKLGRMPMETELEDDVRAEVADLDLQVPPINNQPSLIQTHEAINIKQEDDDEGPSRAEIPYPPSRARDVAMEVQKIRENRDRWRIESRTGGLGPQVSVCMYTFHNTKDSMNCIDFSGDYKLVAAGFAESYIRVWSMDGKPIETRDDAPPKSSHRMIGHSGPVYTVSFAPSTETPPGADAKVKTEWLLSSSADGTIRLWNLDIWQCVVCYRGHVGPVWSVAWGPVGHYFASAGADKTARVWSTDKIRQLRILAGHDSDVEVVCYHPNSAYVFTAGLDRTVRMWLVTNGVAVRMFTSHTSYITALSCSRNGKILASADEGGTICLWDLGPGRLLKRMRGHSKGGVWSLSWSVESNVLVSGGADNTVRVWDIVGPGKADAAVAKVSAAVAGSSATANDASKNADGTTAAPGSVSAGGANTTVSSATSAAPPSAPSAPTANLSASGTGAKKSKKEVGVSADQLGAYLTKASPVYKVAFTNMNLVIAGGAYLG